MEYPTLYVKQKSRQMLDAFLGYNHNLRINENELFDMKNMTSDHYPVLAPRKSRSVFLTDIDANGLIAKDKLCYVNGTGFVIGDEFVDMDLSGGTKDLISMGSYVIIMPDKKWINTIKNGDEYEFGNVDAEYESTGNVQFCLCTQTGEPYDFGEIFYDEMPPVGSKNEDGEYEIPNGQLWIDSSSRPYTLKKYYSVNKMWSSVSTYVKITFSAPGIGEKFSKNDGIKISGITCGDVYDLSGNNLNNNHNLVDCGDDYIIIPGFCESESAFQDDPEHKVTITRKMPDLDFVTECNNRLWGCKYGTNADGEVVNEIYASKLGDFKNWNCFMNISTDSYRASCGSDGPFTGAITHKGYPLFFKENGMHKVYGDFPSNFRINYTPCRGVQQGSHKSLAIVGDTLFYKSGNSVCAYDGSLPVEVSSALGDTLYYDAIACAYGNKYYINMMDGEHKFHLFVFDAAKGVWHKEDDLQVDAFCSYMNELYAIDHNTKSIIAMVNQSADDEESVKWMVETGRWGMSVPDMKYISKLLIRMSLNEGSSLKVSIQYDTVGKWEQVCQMTATNLRSFSIPVRPRRCDHFRIRIEGEGMGHIYSITKTIEQGSDIS